MRRNISKDWNLIDDDRTPAFGAVQYIPHRARATDYVPKYMPEAIRSRILWKLDEIDPKAWNLLTRSEYPFLRHEFLSGLERRGCLGRRTGWKPAHLIFENAQGELIAGLPMYLKSNSFGEFVFDWAWADAYQRTGLEYYPKLVVAVPFTPATGPRILIAEQYRSDEMWQKVLTTAIDTARRFEVSGLHLLFSNNPGDLEHPDLLRRAGCQFHWTNRGYSEFGDFTDSLTAKKRKLIKRERRLIADSGIELERIPGNEVSTRQWDEFYTHYRSTFDQYANFAALTREFFLQIARTMGEQVLLVVARRAHRMIASAYFLVGPSALYGRYWGCSEAIPGLHFEACYYQGIEYCIEKKLVRFEPGAQGEHKISRGFLPTRTWSGHWIKDTRFRAAIAQFLHQESLRMNQTIDDLNQHSPYREGVVDSEKGTGSR
ncbi:MAG: GNAT family N-acetyltransferase [Methylococcales bacterium]